VLLVAVSLLIRDGIWSFKSKIHPLATEAIIVIQTDEWIGKTCGRSSSIGMMIPRKGKIKWIMGSDIS
jgi:hypothetical protein